MHPPQHNAQTHCACHGYIEAFTAVATCETGDNQCQNCMGGGVALHGEYKKRKRAHSRDRAQGANARACVCARAGRRTAPEGDTDRLVQASAPTIASVILAAAMLLVTQHAPVFEQWFSWDLKSQPIRYHRDLL
jgi:hypothetical protein